MSTTLLTPFLLTVSILNSVLLILTVWAGLELHHQDLWVVFMLVFLMGLAYEIAYIRRKLSDDTTPRSIELLNRSADYEVHGSTISRPAAALTRSTPRRPVTPAFV